MNKLIIVPLLFLVGCLKISAHEDALCDTKTVMLPGSGVVVPGTYTVGTSFKFTQADLQDKLSYLNTLKVVGGDVQTAVTGQTLDFLDSLKLTLVADGQQDLLLLNYQKTGTNVTQIDLQNVDTDVLAYFNSSGATVKVEATGSVPQNDWSLGVALCLGASVDKTYP